MAAAGNEDYLDRFFNSAAAATSGTSSPGIPQGQAWNAPVRSPSGSPRKAAGTPTRFSPTWRQESIPTGGAAAADAANSPGGNPFGGAGGSTSPGPGSTGGPVHRRVMSTASSHQRTLSGGSIDIYGSMPGTPSRIDGPERSIAAPFAAEMEGELSVEPGDRVKVHSEVGGWARVLRVTDLRGGLVPSWAVGPEL